MRVLCCPKLWEGFLRRCKKEFPIEHVEALWGRESGDDYVIEAFRRLDFEGSGEAAKYTDMEIVRQKCLATKHGKTFLGTAHTHPSSDYDPAPSSDDHLSGHSDGEKIMGVVKLSLKQDSKRKKFAVDAKWWFPQKPLEFVLTPNESALQPERPQSGQ